MSSVTAAPYSDPDAGREAKPDGRAGRRWRTILRRGTCGRGRGPVRAAGRAGCCSTTCRSGSARAPRSRWSARTAPARRRCCGSSPATWCRTPARSPAPAGSGVMRQIVGAALGDDPTVADLLLQRLAAADPGGRRRGRPLRARADGDRRREDPDGLRPRALGVRRRRRLRHRGHLGRLHDGGARRCPTTARSTATLQHPLRRRAEAAGAGVPAPRPRRGAAARRARQLPRRARQDLARGPDPRVRQDGPDDQPRPRAARQHRDPGRHRRARPRRQPGVDPPGRLRVVPRGAPRPVRSASRSCASAGTRSTPSSSSWCCTTRSSPSTTTAWPRSTAPPRPGCASSRRPARRPSSRASSR